MAKFIVRIPDSYAPRFTSNIVEIDADTDADAKSKAYQLLNIPTALLSVTPKADESKALQNAATKLEDLETSAGENVVESQLSFGRFGWVPSIRTNQVAASELGQATGALNQYNLNRQLADLYALGEGETASATPFSSRVMTPSGTTSSSLYGQLGGPFVAGNNDDLLRLDELESEMFARLARGASVPADLTAEINRLRSGQDYEEGSLAYGLFKKPEGSGDPGDPKKLGDSGDPEVITDDIIVTDTTGDNTTGFGFGVPSSTGSLGSATSLQDLLNLFLSNPADYFYEVPIYEDVYDENGVVVDRIQVGTEQVLSPLAEAALQAYSTQRGSESMDLASRFGTATPFGAIAGLGGTAEQAIALAELQARAGVTNPYAALGTGSAIGDIGTILRGGLTPEEQLALEGLQARGGLTAEERLAELQVQYNPFSETAQDRLALARAQASGGLTNELNILAAQQAAAANNPFAAAQLGIGIDNISTILRGGLTPEQQLAIAQAPGNPFGLSAQQQIDLQNQLARGGLTAEEQRDLIGLQARGGLTAQERLAEQRLAALSPLLQASPGTLGGLSRVLGGEAQLQGLFSPFTSDSSAAGTANVMQQTSPTPFTRQSMERPRQTIGDYQRADLFDRGAIEAEAGMAGEELDRYLGQVSLGAGSPRGSLGAQLA